MDWPTLYGMNNRDFALSRSPRCYYWYTAEGTQMLRF